MLSSSKRSQLKLAIKSVLTVLVLAFVARHVYGTWLDLKSRGESIRIEWPWVGGSIALYLVGLSVFGAYFWQVLESGTKSSSFIVSLRAYLISHLGKYVPGKAMVVVMRAGLVVPYGVRPATAAFATLYETLVMMVSGALVAGIGFAIGNRSSASLTIYGPGGRVFQIPFALVGFTLAVAFLVIVWPTIFPRLAGLIRAPLRSVGPEALPRFSFGLLFSGLASTSIGWLFLGLSQVAVLRAISPGGLDTSDWILAIGSVALATVAGFVVPIAPGGLGVREWVLWTALGSAIDRDLAVVAALLLRLAWVAAEVFAAAILTAFRPAVPGPSLT